jgi:nucleoside phosphorylase
MVMEKTVHGCMLRDEKQKRTTTEGTVWFGQTKPKIWKKRYAHSAYTVGWICALPVELAAAQALLDEEHGELPRDDFDPNLYTLGRIGTLNIVITCLPAGHVGIGPAAASAARMMCRFKSLRFGLMVGVGGGVPNLAVDIRLGDVVVSHPFNQHSGVVQYDLGKTGKAGQRFRTGFLNSPPPVLLNAVSQLRADQHRERDSFTTHMAAFNKLPSFSRNVLGPDTLFEADYIHEGGTTCEECKRDRVVYRTMRHSTDKVAIHYGTIASGNQVIKDGVTRDRLSGELGGALCFEMEAAGLMNSFPCLVVRGICDYADSHKSKTWQPYAAATAAACAKAILSLVPQLDVNNVETTIGARKCHIPFSLWCVPRGKFADRRQDMQALERSLLPHLHQRGRQTMALHGLGGIGKTQLAASFARRHQNDFSSIFWLDGRNESSIKNSFATCVSRVVENYIAEGNDVSALTQNSDLDSKVKFMLDWLSMINNRNWLLVVDGVDQDHRACGGLTGAYDLEDYIPGADHGSVLLTTRSSHFGHMGELWELSKVDVECAQHIWKLWYGKQMGKYPEHKH